MSMPSGLDSVFRALGKGGMDLTKVNLSKGVPQKAEAEEAPSSKDGAEFEGILDQSADSENAPVEVNAAPQDEASTGSEDTVTTDGRELVAMAEAPVILAPEADQASEGKLEAALIHLALKIEAPKAEMAEPLQPSVEPSEIANMNQNEVKIEGLPAATLLDSKEWESVEPDAKLAESIEALQANTVKAPEAKGLERESVDVPELAIEPKSAEPKVMTNEPKLDVVTAATNDGGFEGDAESSKDFHQDSGAREMPSKNLKHFADSLSIRSQLNPEAPASFQGELVKVQVSEAPEVSGLKSHVMNEIKPLISKVQLTQEGGEMTIQLRPAHLGQMKVDISVVGDSVKVNMAAEKIESRAILQSQMSDLKQELQKGGLKVDQISVSSLNSQGTIENSRPGQDADSRHHHQESSHKQSQREHQESSKNSQGRESESFWKRLANETEEAA